jgi:diacylglycerol kinase family enzyme
MRPMAAGTASNIPDIRATHYGVHAMRNILVILNARAGTLIDIGSDGVHAALHDALDGPDTRITVREVQPRAMLDAIARGAQADYDTIIIGGGDGSVSAAVGALTGSGKTLGVIPCGTLNLLARDLGMPDEPLAAIAALARAEPRAIDLAAVNGRPFHTLSGLGFFSQMARAREEVRDLPGKLLRVGAAAIRALSRTGCFYLDVEIDGRTRHFETYGVLVTCNRFAGAQWRRTALDGNALEVHIAQGETTFERLRTGAELLAGTWRDNAGIVSLPAQAVSIASARRRAWVATDGELRRETAPLHYEIRPTALTILAAGAADRGSA